MAYKKLTSSLENAMMTTFAKWDRQDQRDNIVLPTEVNSLLQAFLVLIKAYLARVNREGPFGEKTDMIGAIG